MLFRSGLQSTKTFGALKGRSEDWLLSLLRRCVTAGWVDFTAGERPMVLLTPAGKAVLFAEGPVRLLLPPEHAPKKSNRSGGASGRRARAAAATMTPADEALFETLRTRRLELARADGVPPYVVASDRTLRELAELRPRTRAALEGVFGIGPAKAAKYGDAFLAAVRDAG